MLLFISNYNTNKRAIHGGSTLQRFQPICVQSTRCIPYTWLKLIINDTDPDLRETVAHLYNSM